MTRLAREYNSLNLAQGFPNWPCPDLLKDAAMKAISENINQYAITWGAQRLREALARKYSGWYGMNVDPAEEITVTCGATEAMISTMLALVEPGDEVIIAEPFYENYGPDVALSGACPVYFPMPPGKPMDLDLLRATFRPSTRAIVVNTPSNPAGRVLTRAELETIRDLCIQHDAIAITDEIYEHIRYEGEHIPIASLEGMKDRTVTISGASKTFSVTGWRIGWAIAPREMTDAIRKVHDFLTVGAPAPLQEAVALALDELPRTFYGELADSYRKSRDSLVGALIDAGFECQSPEGAYYVLADFSSLSDLDDTAFAIWLSREVGVTPVPGSSFFGPGGGQNLVRFAFCKTVDVIEEAAKRLRDIKRGGVGMAPRNEDVAARSGLQQ